MLRAIVLSCAAVVLAGCQTFSPDGGMSPVASFSNREMGKDVAVIKSREDAEAARVAVKKLLKRSLTSDSAVQVALLSNRGLQAAYNELAIAEAAMVGESLPPNPTFSISRIAGAGTAELERQIAFDILAIATLPARSEIAEKRFRQAQLRAIMETLRVAAETRRAYFKAVAANELTKLLSRAETTAKSTAILAIKLGESGSLNKLDQAREQSFYAETSAELATARLEAGSAREQLTRLLGLWGQNLAYVIPDRLPQLPSRPKRLPAVEAEAVSRRVDLQIERIELDALAKQYGLAQATRFVNMLEVAGISKKTTANDGSTESTRGLSAQIEIPIFDFGQVRARTAEARYLQAVNRLVQKAVDVRSEAREAYRTYRATYDIASHYQRDVLPLREIITEENQLRFSAMQIDVFALLQEARQRIAALKAAIDSKRAFWQAANDLTAATMGGGAIGSGESRIVADASAATSK
ncbi:MAG: TolC family protein [Rhodopseudomonas sp.]|nr:TolC family protein [Rhodopseudomonas sp.]